MRIECDVSYDPALDRLVGGDFAREVSGSWIRSFLMAATHAMQLRDRLQQLDSAFRADNVTGDADPVPYPRVLAVISPGGLPGAIDGRPQLVPLDLAFGATQLRSAPAAYRDVAQLVCAVDDPRTLAEQRPHTTHGRQAFAVNLFSVLSCAHRRLHWALTRGAGSSVDASTVSPLGHLQDPYFIVAPGDHPGAELRRGQRQDLTRALSLAVDLGGGRDGMHHVLLEAVAAYSRTPSVPSSLSMLVDRVIRYGEAPTLEAVGELAEAVLSGRW